MDKININHVLTEGKLLFSELLGTSSVGQHCVKQSLKMNGRESFISNCDKKQEKYN